MAKIIRERRPKPSEEYAGRRVECSHCGCLWEIEAGDSVKLHEDTFGREFLSLICPKCGIVVSHTTKPGTR